MTFADRDGPGRLWWSLLDMFRFYAKEFVTACTNLAVLGLMVRHGQKGDTPESKEAISKAQQEVVATLKEVAAECEKIGWLDMKERAIRIRDYAKSNFDEPDGVIALGNDLHADIMGRLRRRVFLFVKEDRQVFIDQDALFGEEVSRAFPSAQRDITAAGNCLAVECPTAAVFHLMRAAEVALRALAMDRQVQYPDASLAVKQVGDLLAALDGKLAALRRADAKNWPSRDIKDAQIRFYHSAVAEFRDFNEAWRKHMAHGHDGAFYDRHHARSIMEHVCNLMEKLAEKISESGVTSEYWTTA